MNLNQEITQLLENEGCKIFGFADLQILPLEQRQGFDTGIVMPVRRLSCKCDKRGVMGAGHSP